MALSDEIVLTLLSGMKSAAKDPVGRRMVHPTPTTAYLETFLKDRPGVTMPPAFNGADAAIVAGLVNLAERTGLILADLATNPGQTQAQMIAKLQALRSND